MRINKSILKNLKSKLGFFIRGCIGIWHNFYDTPQIRIPATGSIGKTQQGNKIEYYSFGSGAERILYFAGIHGNEVGSIKLMHHWLHELSNNTPENTTVFVIPCLNIDGYTKALKHPDYFGGGKIGKTNANDVDLNRNFPTSDWQSESKLFVTGKYISVSAGDRPGGEPELSALLDFIQQQNISTVYTFHNCWSTVFSLADSERLESYSKYSGYRKYTLGEWNKLDSAHKAGNMNTWGKENDINVIEVELQHRWGSDWKQNKKALIQSLGI